MTMIPVGGGHQRLIQRVRRHAEMSVLFGGSAAAEAATSAPLFTAAPSGVVQAMLWPAEAGPVNAEPAADPWSPAEGGWSDEDRLTAAIEQAEAGHTLPRLSARSAPPRPPAASPLPSVAPRSTERATPLNVPAIQRVDQPPAALKSTTPPTAPTAMPTPAPVPRPSDDALAAADEEEDPIWQRLQSILRRHKQQEAPPPAPRGGAAEPAPTIPPTVQRTASPRQPPAQPGQMAEPAATSRPTVQHTSVPDQLPAQPGKIAGSATPTPPAVMPGNQPAAQLDATATPASPPLPMAQGAKFDDRDSTGASRPSAAEPAPSIPTIGQQVGTTDQPDYAATTAAPRLPSAEAAPGIGLTASPALRRAAEAEMPFVRTAPASAEAGPAHEPRPPSAEPIGDADSALAPDIQRAVAAVESPNLQRAATGSDPARATQPPSGEAPQPAPLFDKTATSSPVRAAAEPDDQPDRVDDRPVPLQAVWPVESVGPAEAAWPIDDKGPMTPAQPVESSAVAPPSPLRLAASEDEAIQRALMGVAAGQPTRSAVELVLPRRARPATAAEPPASPTVMRQSLPDAPAPSRVTDRATPSGRPFTGEESAPVGDMIGTEIGPLPADLWRTLGETPPAANPVPPAAAQLTPVEPFPQPATDAAAVEAAIRAAEAPAGRAGTRLPPGARPVVASRPTVAPQQVTAPPLTVAARLTSPQPLTTAARLTTAQRFPAGTVADSAIETTADVRSTRMAWTGAPQQAVSGLTGTSQPLVPAPRLTVPAAMPEPAAAELVSREVIQPTAVEHVSSPAVLAAMRSEAPAGLEWADSPARAAAGIEAPPFAIQRQTEDAAAPAGSPASPAAGPVEGPASEVDVDELARRVYSEVKRRLALEWERARGRLG